MNRPSWSFFGNSWAVSLLQKHVAGGKVRHAYLIHGQDGVGKRTLALKFASAIFCQSGIKGEPCGVCPSCKKVEQGQGFDLKMIQRIPGKREILIDQVREAEAFLRITPYAAEKKVVIFQDFDLANGNTQNALLKTLEEAPPYAVLILLTQQPQSLLPTVLSRCEKLELRPVGLQEMRDYLVHLAAEPQTTDLISHIADGSPGIAFRLAKEGDEILRERREALDTFFSVLSLKLHERFNLADQLVRKDTKAREQAKTRAKKLKTGAKDLAEEGLEEDDPLEEGLAERWLLYWLHLCGDLRIRALGSTASITNIDQTDQIEQYSHKLGFAATDLCYGAIEKALFQMRADGNKRMVLECLFLDLPQKG